MAPVPKVAQNPFTKAKSIYVSLGSLLEMIESSTPEAINKYLAELKEATPTKSTATKPCSSTVQSIMQLLEQYPGFERSILSDLKSQIANAKQIGVLDQYQTALKTEQIKKPRGPYKSTSKDESPAVPE